jgi:uncharacterized coiled-coil protein SlyX
MDNDCSIPYYSNQWVYTLTVTDNWKKLQINTIDSSKTDKLNKKYNHLKKVISDPNKYNTNLASKDDIESLQQQIDELNLTVTALQEDIEYLQEDIEYLSLNLSKLENTSPNPYGDDDYATPK